MMCLENVVIGLASDVCRSCRWKFTVVHSAGVLIKVIHQSAPSSPSIFWTLLNSMLIPWSKLLHKHLKKCPPCLLTKLMWSNQCHWRKWRACNVRRFNYTWHLGFRDKWSSKTSPDAFSIAFSWRGRTTEKTWRSWINSPYLSPLRETPCVYSSPVAV